MVACWTRFGRSRFRGGSETSPAASSARVPPWPRSSPDGPVWTSACNPTEEHSTVPDSGSADKRPLHSGRAKLWGSDLSMCETQLRGAHHASWMSRRWVS